MATCGCTSAPKGTARREMYFEIELQEKFTTETRLGRCAKELFSMINEKQIKLEEPEGQLWKELIQTMEDLKEWTSKTLQYADESSLESIKLILEKRDYLRAIRETKCSESTTDKMTRQVLAEFEAYLHRCAGEILAPQVEQLSVRTWDQVKATLATLCNSTNGRMVELADMISFLEFPSRESQPHWFEGENIVHIMVLFFLASSKAMRRLLVPPNGMDRLRDIFADTVMVNEILGDFEGEHPFKIEDFFLKEEDALENREERVEVPSESPEEVDVEEEGTWISEERNEREPVSQATSVRMGFRASVKAKMRRAKEAMTLSRKKRPEKRLSPVKECPEVDLPVVQNQPRVELSRKSLAVNFLVDVVLPEFNKVGGNVLSDLLQIRSEADLVRTSSIFTSDPAFSALLDYLEAIYMTALKTMYFQVAAKCIGGEKIPLPSFGDSFGNDWLKIVELGQKRQADLLGYLNLDKEQLVRCDLKGSSESVLSLCESFLAPRKPSFMAQGANNPDRSETTTWSSFLLIMKGFYTPGNMVLEYLPDFFDAKLLEFLGSATGSSPEKMDFLSSLFETDVKGLFAGSFIGVDEQEFNNINQLGSQIQEVRSKIQSRLTLLLNLRLVASETFDIVYNFRVCFEKHLIAFLTKAEVDQLLQTQVGLQSKVIAWLHEYFETVSLSLNKAELMVRKDEGKESMLLELEYMTEKLTMKLIEKCRETMTALLSNALTFIESPDTKEVNSLSTSMPADVFKMMYETFRAFQNEGLPAEVISFVLQGGVLTTLGEFQRTLNAFLSDSTRNCTVIYLSATMNDAEAMFGNADKFRETLNSSLSLAPDKKVQLFEMVEDRMHGFSETCSLAGKRLALYIVGKIEDRREFLITTEEWQSGLLNKSMIDDDLLPYLDNLRFWIHSDRSKQVIASKLAKGLCEMYSRVLLRHAKPFKDRAGTVARLREDMQHFRCVLESRMCLREQKFYEANPFAHLIRLLYLDKKVLKHDLFALKTGAIEDMNCIAPLFPLFGERTHKAVSRLIRRRGDFGRFERIDAKRLVRAYERGLPKEQGKPVVTVLYVYSLEAKFTRVLGTKKRAIKKQEEQENLLLRSEQEKHPEWAPWDENLATHRAPNPAA